MSTNDSFPGLELALGDTAMSCAQAEQALAGQVHGEATSPDERLRAHLAVCAGCAELMDDIRAGTIADALLDVGVAREPDLDALPTVARDLYVRGQEVARGGMGRVVRARDRRLGRSVAVKELLDDSLRDRFEKEARLTARLQHPAIVNVHEAGRWPDGEPFYVMKYVAGEALSDRLRREPTLAGRLALLPSLMAAVDGLAYAHAERIVHRDLKPANIIVGAYGETVVVDWGLAKDLSDGVDEPAAGPYRDASPSLTQAGAGTPAYMAPEQARGEPPDERVDVHALGATLYHLLAGHPPDGRPLDDAAPVELRAIVAKAMAEEPADRYRHAGELAEDLRRYQAGKLVAAHAYRLRDLAGRFVRRHRLPLAIAALALAGVATGGAVAVANVVEARREAVAGRALAEEREAALLVEGARQDVLAGRHDEASELLARARALGHDDRMSRFLAAEIGRARFQRVGAVLPAGPPLRSPLMKLIGNRTAHGLPALLGGPTFGLTRDGAFLGWLACDGQGRCAAVARAPGADGRLRISFKGWPIDWRHGDEPLWAGRTRPHAGRSLLVTHDGGEPGLVRAWDDRGVARWHAVLPGAIADVDLAPTAGRAFAATVDGRVFALDLAGGTVAGELGRVDGKTCSLAASRDGASVAVLGCGGELTLLPSGARLRLGFPAASDLPGDVGPLVEVADDGAVLVWQVGARVVYLVGADGTLEVALPTDDLVVHAGWVGGEAFTLAGGALEVWSRRGERQRILRDPGMPWLGAFAAGGAVAFTIDLERGISVWSAPGGGSRDLPAKGVVGAGFRSDRELVTVNRELLVEVWRDGRSVASVALPAGKGLPGIEIAPGAGTSWILWSSELGGFVVDPEAGQVRRAGEPAANGLATTTVRGLAVLEPARARLFLPDGGWRDLSREGDGSPEAISGDGRWLVLHRDEGLFVRDLDRGTDRLLRPLDGLTYTSRLSHDGGFVFLRHARGGELWNLASHTHTAVDPIVHRALGVTADGSILGVPQNGVTWIAGDRVHRQLGRAFDKPLALSPSGLHVSGDDLGQLRLWMGSSLVKNIPSSGDGKIELARFSPSGDRLIIASRGSTRVLDLSSR